MGGPVAAIPPMSARELEAAPFTGTPADDWARPDIGLLESAPDTDVSQDKIDATAETIRKTLAEYGVEVADRPDQDGTHSYHVRVDTRVGTTLQTGPGDA